MSTSAVMKENAYSKTERRIIEIIRKLVVDFVFEMRNEAELMDKMMSEPPKDATPKEIRLFLLKTQGYRTASDRLQNNDSMIDIVDDRFRTRYPEFKGQIEDDWFKERTIEILNEVNPVTRK